MGLSVDRTSLNYLRSFFLAAKRNYLGLSFSFTFLAFFGLLCVLHIVMTMQEEASSESSLL